MRLTRHEAAPQTQAETLENAAIEQMRHERDTARSNAQSFSNALEAEKRSHDATNRALHYEKLRTSALRVLYEDVWSWVSAYGTTKQNDDAVQAVFHHTRKKLEEIDDEGRKP